MPPAPLPLEVMQKNAEQAEALLKILANRNRLMILCHLVKDRRSVGELTELVGLSQSSVSQHLAKMREQDLVTTQKEGQTVYYRLHDPKLEAILSTLYLVYCQ
ncbi:metalloregulator ArsR/SmtB family transcription factor [Asticcacaulis sp. BYS171W]|uniref:Metalloregulator ArsR/SmtB family transcription factor n=1 Tax=Asticcacaulis aquaticus TaxID=2984212 RepID=A0ABT5HX96_9CAUL|nr:metalloregulator ArsR/SmtB family transcription factor [Asticcacaulis aquaticus]MDC7684688.1 metalloregulator ArsR/SmtB family transcription factor [Asticcacaulis aquaticus]